MSPAGHVANYDSADEWAPLADPANAIATTDVWEDHFASWGEAAAADARAEASEAFGPLAADFMSTRTKDLEAEKKRQEEWLAQRSRDIIEQARPEAGVTPGLFDQPQAPPRRDWVLMRDGPERLVAFAADRTGPPQLKTEADTAIRVHRDRMADLEARLDLAEPETLQLGLLMIVPAKGGKHGS
jgi:hypothetical protein